MSFFERFLICVFAAAWTITAITVPTRGSTSTGLDSKTTAKIDSLVAIVMAHQHVPAITLAIGRNGDILYARGYGYRNLSGSLATTTTVYNIGSVTKQFTAACIMLLQQAGKLSVDDSLAKYLPTYPYARQITIRNLLDHTSGIPDYTDLPNLPHTATAMQFFRMVWKQSLDFRPGTRYEYSNTNYIVLGMIVEKASGQAYSDFVATRIFRPLGLNDSSTRIEPRDVPNGATGYTFENGRVRYEPATRDDIGYGDGTINSTALDLVKWDAALDGGKVVDAASWREMTTPPAALYEPPYGGYGFGLDIGRFYGQRMIDHSGSNPGFITLNATFPRDGLEIVMLANSDNFDPLLLFQRIFELVERPSAAQIAQQENPVPNEDPKIRAVAQRWLARLQTGQIDPSELTAGAARVVTPAAARAATIAASAIGKPRAFIYEGVTYRGRALRYSYRLTFASATVLYDIVINDRGKIEALDLLREDPALL